MREKLGEDQDDRAGERPAADHLEGHVAAKTVSNHEVASELGSEPARLARVALHGQVVRSGGASEAGHCRGDEADRRVAHGRLCEQVVVEGRGGERAGKQKHGVLGSFRSGFTKDPAEVLSGGHAHETRKLLTRG